MSSQFTLETAVTYGDVDRHETMLLSRFFKVLQDAAIGHANQFGTGTNAVATRAESWVLNRIDVRLARLPRPGDSLRVDTWSCGIRGFRGYRDFRVQDGLGREVATATSLWVYISLRSKSIVRVPREVADRFPVGAISPMNPALEDMPLSAPAEDAWAAEFSLRFGDFDVNEHVNNAAYLDLVQTALARSGAPVHPRRIAVHYQKPVPLEATTVRARVARDGSLARFAIDHVGTTCLTGLAE